MRPKKDGEFVNAKLERSLADRLNKYIAETGYPKTVVIEKALKAYLNKHAEATDDAKGGA